MKDIYWIRNDARTRLAIVARPRGDDQLERDLAGIKRGGIEGIVSLLTGPEEEVLGLGAESSIAGNLGLSFFSFPIIDRQIPDNAEAFSRFIATVAGHLKAGMAIGIHCRGSIGRSSVTATSLLVQLGWQAGDALEEVELARRCPVPDTAEQKAWILALEPPYSAR